MSYSLSELFVLCVNFNCKSLLVIVSHNFLSKNDVLYPEIRTRERRRTISRYGIRDNANLMLKSCYFSGQRTGSAFADFFVDIKNLNVKSNILGS